MDRVADIFAGITLVALVTTIVAHKNSANLVKQTGKAYAEALNAAMSIR